MAKKNKKPKVDYSKTWWGGGYGYDYDYDYDYGKTTTPKYSNTGWRSYYYTKPKYGIDKNLAGRIKRLLKTITGKDYQLINWHEWRATGTKIGYVGSDIENAFDEEVFGLILRELARQMFYSWSGLKKENSSTSDLRPYRHLRALLEERRAVRLLGDNYIGARQYLDAWKSWQVLKIEEIRANAQAQGQDLQEFNETPQGILCAIDDYTTTGDRQNLPAELPELIDEYIGCDTFRATSEVYEEIRKYYPKLDEDDEEAQEQMRQCESQVPTTGGLSNNNERALSQQKEDDEAGEAGQGDTPPHWLRKDLAKWQHIKSKHNNLINVIAKHIKRVLAENTARRLQGRYRSGTHLSARRLARAGMGLTRRPFVKVQQEDTPHYVFGLILDQSGSMAGKPNEVANLQAVIMAEALELAGVDYGLYGYGDEAFRYKSIGAKLDREFASKLFTADFGGTQEANAVKMFNDDIEQVQHHKRGSAFLVSDGDTYDRATTTEQWKRAKAQGILPCVSWVHFEYQEDRQAYEEGMQTDMRGIEKGEVVEILADDYEEMIYQTTLKLADNMVKIVKR